mmetsp:Transcript_36891/g.93122  ORF Transcript_36891/g.93122 Transcript_36891/m.93122 type:complete len:264 (+) Transcript_36891:55-846(+)
MTWLCCCELLKHKLAALPAHTQTQPSMAVFHPATPACPYPASICQLACCCLTPGLQLLARAGPSSQAPLWPPRCRAVRALRPVTWPAVVHRRVTAATPQPVHALILHVHVRVIQVHVARARQVQLGLEVLLHLLRRRLHRLLLARRRLRLGCRKRHALLQRAQQRLRGGRPRRQPRLQLRQLLGAHVAPDGVVYEQARRALVQLALDDRGVAALGDDEVLELAHGGDAQHGLQLRVADHLNLERERHHCELLELELLLRVEGW